MGAQGLTFLQVVNRVLNRLRENSAATVSESTYSTFIGTLVNQVKAEIEKAYKWQALRQTYEVDTLTDGTTSYAFTGSGPEAEVLEGWNTTTGALLTKNTNEQFNVWFFGAGSGGVQQGDTTDYIPSGITAAYDQRIEIFPKPTAVNVLKFVLFQPQADLSNDTDVALIPQGVLIEETIARAKVERGDDDAPKPQGMPGDTFILRELLDTEIARESGNDPGETDWDVE